MGLKDIHTADHICLVAFTRDMTNSGRFLDVFRTRLASGTEEFRRSFGCLSIARIQTRFLIGLTDVRNGWANAPVAHIPNLTILQATQPDLHGQTRGPRPRITRDLAPLYGSIFANFALF